MRAIFIRHGSGLAVSNAEQVAMAWSEGNWTVQDARDRFQSAG